MDNNVIHLKGLSVKLDGDYYDPHVHCRDCGDLAMAESFGASIGDDGRLHLKLTMICSNKDKCGRQEEWDLATAFEYTNLGRRQKRVKT
jgi:hypothetical protein